MTERILHFLSTPRAEGTPNLVLDWLRSGADHWQGVVVLNSQPADLTDQLRAAADAYEEYQLFDRGYSKFIGISRTAFAAVRKYRPDVVICWPTGFANWVCAGAACARAHRLLVHCGNPPRRGWRADWLTRYVMWPLTALGARCVCCSEYVCREYQSVPWVPRKLFHVVWNSSRGAQIAAAADRGRALRNGCMARRAIMVATLEAHKDHDTLLRAVPLVRRRCPDFELWLVGEGTLRDRLEKTISALGIDEYAKLLGKRTDVGELLGQADLFIYSTTRQEGLGTALIEALAADLPIIASDVPACREMLVNGQYGELVAPQNVIGLADAIVAALTAKTVAIDGGRAFAISLDPKHMMNAYTALGRGVTER